MITPDPVLTSFTHAFDMNLMGAAIAKAWPTLPPVKSCRIERFRYRPGSRAVFLYELETGAATEWVTGALFADRKRDKLRKVQSINNAFDAALNMTFERFPSDRKLPGLSLLLASREELVSRLFAAGVIASSADVTISNVRPMRYRPGLAAVMRIDLKTGNAGARTIYAKTYASADVAEIHRDFREPRGGDRHQLARTLGCLPPERIVFWEAAAGTPLPEFLKTGAVDMSRIASGLAAIAEFHRQPGMNAKQTSAAKTVALETRTHASFITSMLPKLSGALDRLCQTLPKPFTDDVMTPVHGDMKPEHVFLSGEAATLIDVEGIELSDPILDLGNLMARFDQLSRMPEHSPDACRHAFELAAAMQTEASDAKRAAAYALGKLKTATYAVRHQEPGWAEAARAIVDECATTLLPV